MKILAFDIGTSSVRAAIYDPAAGWGREPVGQVALEVQRPEPGAAELVPQMVRAAADTLFKQAQARLQATGEREVWVTAAGFWHSLLGLDEERRPLTPCWIWEDTRSEPVVAMLVREKIGGSQLTGCPQSFVFWPSRLAFYRENFREEFDKVAHWVSLPDLVMEGLGLRATGTTSLSMASGTGLVGRAENTWATSLAREIGLRAETLPTLDHAATECTIDGILYKTLSPLGDGAAGTLGSGITPGEETLALNFGTSAAVRRLRAGTIEQVPSGIFEYKLDARRTILGGAVNNAGNVYEWARDTLRVPEDPAALEAALAVRAGPITDLSVQPFLAGERTPYWSGNLHGGLTGLTLKHTPLDILQAIQEATFYNLRSIADQLDAARVCEIVVSGGLARSPASLQRLAQVMARPLVVLEEQEVSLYGAVLFAAEHLGLAASKSRRGRVYLPDPELVARYDEVRKRHLTAADRYVQRMGKE